MVEKVKGWSCGWFQEALVGVGRRFSLIPFPVTHPPADFSPGVVIGYRLPDYRLVKTCFHTVP